MESGINLAISSIAIPECAHFRYFEVEVIENKEDVEIYVGIIENNDPFYHFIPEIEALDGK